MLLISKNNQKNIIYYFFVFTRLNLHIFCNKNRILRNWIRFYFFIMFLKLTLTCSSQNMIWIDRFPFPSNHNREMGKFVFYFTFWKAYASYDLLWDIQYSFYQNRNVYSRLIVFENVRFSCIFIRPNEKLSYMIAVWVWPIFIIVSIFDNMLDFIQFIIQKVVI